MNTNQTTQPIPNMYDGNGQLNYLYIEWKQKQDQISPDYKSRENDSKYWN